ncbi:MAG TPA: HD domain-containing phosphohydrolase [Gaiellaceae bacterium]|nr:HD domain-containing phosphohydrolase [Gaiellaceae bacterium]
MHVLLVDDDASLRSLLRATFESFDVAVDEADNAAGAVDCVRRTRPDVIVLDVVMPGMSGIELCRRLKRDPETDGIGVIVLTGSEDGTRDAFVAGCADAVLTKPFSPLELLAAAERLAGGLHAVPFRASRTRGEEEQLLLYARDLRHLLELERGQRRLLENAYRETVSALATALETKDTGTRAHSQRVQQYAIELARGLGAGIAGDPSAEYGYLLHDVGKIGIPDSVLLKPGPLTRAERDLMQRHTELGEQMLSQVAFLQGEGLRIVRSHHERWDGKGYPDRMGGDEIPLGARIFAVADTLDAITSDRPYRQARAWDEARDIILREAGRQFDPDVVRVFREREPELRAVRRELVAA